MIDERKLISELDAWWETLDPRANARDSIICDAIESVMEKIDNAEKVGEWIPASERSPEDLTPVNITWVNIKPAPYYAHVKDEMFTATGILYHGAWYWYSAYCADYLREYGDNKNDAIDEHVEIIAWQPLPEPCREDDEE